ncbi:MAG: energy transducer TonB [Pseudomonadota bacterium]
MKIYCFGILAFLFIAQSSAGFGREPTKPVPRGDIGRWVTVADYPPIAKRENRSGVTYYRASVSSIGRVSRCEIVRSSGHRDLDEKACSQVRRIARFRPAINERGQTMASQFDGKVDWSNLTRKRRFTLEENQMITEAFLEYVKRKNEQKSPE